MRRYNDFIHGERFIGNKFTKEVHDLDNETDHCHIDRIIEDGRAVPFKTLREAKYNGYYKGIYCLIRNSFEN